MYQRGHTKMITSATQQDSRTMVYFMFLYNMNLICMRKTKEKPSYILALNLQVGVSACQKELEVTGGVLNT